MKNFLEKFKKLDFLLPPFFISIFPILSFYLGNSQELSLKFVQRPLIYSVGIFLFLAVGLSFLAKDKYKASLTTSLLVFIFFSYGHLSGALNDSFFIPIGGMILGPDKVFLPIIFSAFSFFVYKLFRSKRDFSKTVTLLSFSLLILVFYQLIAIFGIESKKENVSFQLKEEEGINGQKETPDIYYIILDGYARQDILKDIYDYDNSWFISDLKKLGFYVADKARSNYIHTYLSLPSTLNMRYLDDLPEKYGKNPSSYSEAEKLVERNEVAKKLKSFGYTTINFASSWAATGEDYQADVNFKAEGYFKVLGRSLLVDESEIAFLQTTLLSPLIERAWGDALREKTLLVLQKLPTIPAMEEKKFVTVHIMAPHPPYVFNADGSPVFGAELEMADEGIEKRPKYLGQLEFISNQILPILEKVIKNSKEKPIIILQSDHGPASIFGKRENWLENYSELGVKERSGILYAVYFPDLDYQDFYQSITPVNTFRIIFDKYFGQNYSLLPDNTFYTSYEAMYDFKDVTEIIRE